MAIVAMSGFLHMHSVNIAELRDGLSRYLKQVREGAELVIRDRGRAIAKLVPLSGADTAEQEEMDLVAAGLLRLPERPLPKSFWDMPAPRISVPRLVAAVRADRDGD